LSVEITGHEAVAKQLDAAHFGFDAGSSVVAGQSFPQGASEAIARAQHFIPDDGPSVSGFQGMAFLRGGHYYSGKLRVSWFCGATGGNLSGGLTSGMTPSGLKRQFRARAATRLSGMVIRWL